MLERKRKLAETVLKPKGVDQLTSNDIKELFEQHY
jgi:hypothetical protein